MSGAPLRLSWAQVNDIGMRAENQDHIGVARNGELTCFVLADGTGGYTGGALASQLVVDAMLAAFCAAPACDTSSLRAAVGAASASLARARSADQAYAEMSSTVAALVVDAAAAEAVWTHLGDSRVYLFRANRLHSVTIDHSLARQLVDNSRTGHSALRTHPHRHILLAAIGAENGMEPSTSAGATRLQAGDALLLCSDGLWEWIEEAQMEVALAVTTGSDDWLATMCTAADTAFGASSKVRDNFSACAIRVHAAGEPA
jgi:serine/threonine protein phosphatase PrpC